ncbi:oligosaccharide flippase family protein [Pseudooceanicola aestuarii]|uniref:oligosaccharide flippase family protein n=1 Tax=Pseudooceanicola aestuarii TaxID=2697319 RepID=UPI0013D7C86E|nr:oligosaccharide flippase family protein [Pseudooceanicola aestuarii]
MADLPSPVSPPDPGLAAPPAVGTTRKTLGDGAVTMAERIGAQVSQFTIFVVAARLLGPEEFGIFALVSACAILLLRAAEVGWAPYIMSWNGDALVPRQVVFVAILSGLIFALAGLAGAQLAGLFGLTGDTVLLMSLFALWVWLATVCAAQKGVMTWLDRLKSSALCEIGAEAAGLVVALGTLLQGHGVFSLVYGRLAAQVVQLVLSFRVTRMAPMPGMALAQFKDLWAFSIRIFASRMLIFTRLYAAVFIVGAFLGPAAVGYFRAAERLVSAVAEVIMVPGQLLAWTRLRQARDGAGAQVATPEEGQARMTGALARYMQMLFAVAGPMLVWLIVAAEDLVGGLLSAEWLPAAPLVAILAIARILTVPGLVTEPLMSLSGKAGQLARFTAVVFVISTGLTLVSAQFGLRAVAWGQVAISAAILAATIRLHMRHAGADWPAIWRAARRPLGPLVIAAGIYPALHWICAPLELPPLLRAFGFGIVALSGYLGLLVLLDRRFLRGLLASWRAETP